MSNKNNNPSVWWGQFDIPVDSAAAWQIETLRFAIQHVDKEWQISHQHESHDEALTNKLSLSREVYDPLDYTQTTRHIFRKSSSIVELKPQLADRTVVTRPSTPISLSPGEEVTLFISTPLWIQFEISGKGGSALDELAIYRPSDTWFGPSTREGELCYASQTSGRTNLEKLLIRASRAITPLIIINRASDKLLIERVALPVPLLSLFATPEGLLWTQSATLIRENDGDMAELKLGKEAPKEAKGAMRINKPRRQPGKGMLVRAFSSIFDKGL
tara:strand:+ start:73557 stop:74375 length:819 start_codon:yes stop_codon:yes gene_type:complete